METLGTSFTLTLQMNVGSKTFVQRKNKTFFLIHSRPSAFFAKLRFAQCVTQNYAFNLFIKMAVVLVKINSLCHGPL